MGFWSGLGKILKPVAKALPFIAAPFTGGASLAAAPAMSAMDWIGAGLDTAGGIAEGMGKGRETQNNALQDRAALELRANEGRERSLVDRAQLDMDQRDFGRKAEGTDFANAIRSALAKNIQDVSVNRPDGIPNISFQGGVRPSAMGEEGRAAASLMNEKAMARLRAGEAFSPLPAMREPTVPMPKQPGVWENILGGAGAAGNAITQAQDSAAGRGQSEMIQKILDDLRRRGSGRPIEDEAVGV